MKFAFKPQGTLPLCYVRIASFTSFEGPQRLPHISFWIWRLLPWSTQRWLALSFCHRFLMTVWTTSRICLSVTDLRAMQSKFCECSPIQRSISLHCILENRKSFPIFSTTSEDSLYWSLAIFTPSKELFGVSTDEVTIKITSRDLVLRKRLFSRFLIKAYHYCLWAIW